MEQTNVKKKRRTTKTTGISDYSNIRRGLNPTYKNESFKSGWEQRDSRSIDEKEQDKNLGDRRSARLLLFWEDLAILKLIE